MHKEDLTALVARWRENADAIEPEERDETTYSPEEEADEYIASAIRDCATQLEALLDPTVDTSSNASRQHFIETGEYLRK